MLTAESVQFEPCNYEIVWQNCEVKPRSRAALCRIGTETKPQAPESAHAQNPTLDFGRLPVAFFQLNIQT